MELNQSKCKDMVISFAKEHPYPRLDPTFIVPVVSAKIIGTCGVT